MNTDFHAVFEKLILPAATQNKVKPEEMVKTVFVFSDMQFDSAQSSDYYNKTKVPQWETGFERIKRKYEEAGYELPHLVFWNLTAGRYGAATPKPVEKDEVGCTLVSGYSQVRLKMFLDEGTFGNGEEEEVEEVNVGKDGEVETKTVKKKADPMDGLWKAIGHRAYDMLRVYDQEERYGAWSAIG